MKKLTMILSLILVLSLVMVGCNSSDNDTSEDQVNSEVTETGGEDAVAEEPSSEDADEAGVIEEEASMGYTYDGSLKFSGVDGDFEVAYNDILSSSDAVTTNVHHISSSGEEFDDEVTGVLLDAILAEHGLSQKDFTSIRLIAGDGYEITVPAEVITEHDIILAYEFNGEGLEEKKQPLRAAIDGVRSMYFVSNLVEISFSNEAVAETKNENNLVMLETAVNELDSEEYVYYDSTDMAVTVADLLQSVGSESEDDLFFVAADGYEKAETMAVFKEGYIKFTGEDAPMFLDPDIQKGMYIKSIMKAEAGDITFVSVASAMTALGQTEVNGKTGVAMTAFFEMVGVDAESYIITATDGYQMEIGKDSLADGVFYVHDESGNIGMKFTEDYEKSWSMKDILTVEPVGGEAVADSSDADSEDAAAMTEEWTITFEGLSDGSFDMTSERAERKLDLVELHTERTKNDEKVAEDWTGYGVLDMLAFLHVEEFSALVFEASDGYQVEIPAADIDEETIIAITKDGEPLDSDYVIQLVQNTQFATTWVKGVAKIVVNQ